MLPPLPSQRHLPRELVDAVIDQLGDETVSLLSCCLVHPAWRVRAQFHLFKAIKVSLLSLLHIEPDKQSLLHLSQSLNRKPELARLVQSLTIQVYDDGSDWNSVTVEEALALQEHCCLLVEILPLLTCVRSVTLKDLEDSFEWGNLAQPLQTAILELISRPSITGLNVASVQGMPLLHALRYHHLEHLKLSFIVPASAELEAACSSNAGNDASHISGPSRRSLRTLLLDNDDDPAFLRCMLTGDIARFSALNRLVLASSEWDEPDAQADLFKLFELVQGTLKAYQVHQHGELDTDQPQISSKSLLRLDLIPNLQRLQFDLNWYYLEGIPDQRNTMVDIAEALKLLAVPGNALQTFELTIMFVHPDDWYEDEEQIDLPQRWFEQWAALDDVLSSPHFPFLVPSEVEEGIIYRAWITINFQRLKCPRLPAPSEPRERAYQILEGMKTLDITRLPVGWSLLENCWMLREGGHMQLIDDRESQSFSKISQIKPFTV
ncbi:hypothetical protein BKA70DRAFT_1558429 [Coprinopsis sp. MPI-PUGE-AT-0042]|nr:hypothetical protein BKA70DRAFT_1558429 [Coprinopsis sp. MPI-PUGE-AT-0042]